MIRQHKNLHAPGCATVLGGKSGRYDIQGGFFYLSVRRDEIVAIEKRLRTEFDQTCFDKFKIILLICDFTTNFKWIVFSMNYKHKFEFNRREKKNYAIFIRTKQQKNTRLCVTTTTKKKRFEIDRRNPAIFTISVFRKRQKLM